MLAILTVTLVSSSNVNLSLMFCFESLRYIYLLFAAIFKVFIRDVCWEGGGGWQIKRCESVSIDTLIRKDVNDIILICMKLV